MTTITLNQIRAKSPCSSSWKKALTLLNKSEKSKDLSWDEPIEFAAIINSMGIRDAIWCLRVLTSDEDIKKICWFALDCTKQVKHLMEDSRSIKCLEVTEDYLNGKASLVDLKLVERDASAASVSSAYAYAAYAAAYAASAYAVSSVSSAVSSVSYAAYAVSYAASSAANTKFNQEQLFKEYFGVGK